MWVCEKSNGFFRLIYEFSNIFKFHGYETVLFATLLIVDINTIKKEDKIIEI